MRKTIMLAFATLILAFAGFITDLVRPTAGSQATMTSPAAQIQATGGSAIRNFDAI
ncbi:MAG TPA: hypothetical protein VE224_02925 [Pseudolabrys sp.]|jgi:formate-dependent nitrite reductase membrane component NrfD|nr:hypothetical protein [Pseudolabrys sp.]